MNIQRNILILGGKKPSQNKDYRASCCQYIHVKKYLRTLHSECPSRCSKLSSYFCIDLGLLFTLNTLFVQNVFFTSLCYSIKHVFVQYRKILKHLLS